MTFWTLIVAIGFLLQGFVSFPSPWSLLYAWMGFATILCWFGEYKKGKIVNLFGEKE